MIYIPGTGIMAAYTDSQTGAVSPELYQALAIYLWAWFIVNMIYTVGAIRTSLVLFVDLVVLNLAFVLLAAGYMANNNSVLTAGFSVLLVTSFLSCLYPIF